MAKLFLESTDTSYKVSNSNTTVYGATGDQAVVIDGALTGVTVNSNVERVQFTGSTTDYTYKVVGTNLEVYTAAGSLVTTVGVQTDTTGTQLTFANGTVDAKITGLNAATVGGQTVSATAATAVTIPATAIDTTIASAAAPVFSVSAPVTSVTEAAGAVASYTISLNAAQPAASSVSFALGNVGAATTADYGTAALTAVTGGATLAGSVITFPAGITTATITVPVTVDALTETGEGVSLTLSAPSTGATVSSTAGTASVSIIDPPTPVFSLAASATSVGEGTPAVGTTAAVAAGTITLTVTRAGNTAGTDTVVVQATGGTGTNGAISGSDFTALSQTVSFAPTETTKTVTFTTVADSTREGDEVLTVSLGTPSTGSSISTAAGASSVTLTITNDDANLLPVITTPTTTPSAFIGSSTAVTGISFTDGDDNTGFTVTVQAAGSSQVSYTQSLTNLTVGAKNSAGSVVNTNETSNTIVFTGTKADLNTVLGTLKYTTNSTVPTSEQLVITITDSAGGVATKTLPINIGQSSTLTSGNDSFVGSAGDDEFSGSLANLATTDTINGGNGTDKLVLSAVNSTVVGAISYVEVLDLTLTGASTVTVSTTNFGSALTTVNATGAYVLDGKFNSGTAFNFDATTHTGLTVTDLLVPSTSASSTVTTDAITLNFNGTSTAASVLTALTDTAHTIDTLNIVSNGTFTTANSITTLGGLNATAATVNVSGAQAFTATLPNLGTGVFNGASATGKLTITADAADSASITGGSAGDVLTGNNGLDTISGGAGNDTIDGGANNDTITGGTGVDSLTGGAGNDTFVFTTGDSGNTATTRDTIVDLAENDMVKIGGYGIAALTNDTVLTSTGTIRVDATNKLLVIGTEEINIPTNVSNASFTYKTNSTTDVSDDYILVGSAALTYTNNEAGKLTISGKSIGASTIYANISTVPPTADAVNGTTTVRGSNGVTTLDASTLTAAAVNVTGSTSADSIIGSSQDDTIKGTAGADTVDGGAGNDTFTYLLEGDLFTTNASVDSIVGGSGTADVLSVGTSGTSLTINAADSWARISGVETLTAVANTAAVSLTLGATAQTAGITTVNLPTAASTAGNDGKIDVSAYTTVGVTVNGGAGSDTLTGGSAADSITGGAGSDTISGGSGADTITGGAGVDIIDGGAGNDVLYVAAADTGAVTNWSNANPGVQAAATLDVITVTAGDVINLTSTGTTALTFGSALSAMTATAAVDGTGGAVAEGATGVVKAYTGSYAGGNFTSGAAGSAVLLVWDNDGTGGGTTYDAIVLVGTNSVTATTAGVVTIA